MRIDKLGAHLQAYIQTRPTVNALRLCGRFGTGPQCHVNKLPVELITAIEKFVVEPARVEALKIWSSEYKCFEVKRDIVDDHFTYEEQHEMFHDDTDDKCCGSSQCPFQRDVDIEIAAKHRLVDYAEEEPSLWTGPHDSKTLSWMKKGGMERPTCIFNEHREFVRNHFGIDVWTSNVRLPPLRATLVTQSDEWKSNESQNTTLAYMTLPNNVSSREDWLSGMYDNLHGGLQSGHAMPVKMGAVPTQASIRRFPRAMSILGLDVFIHPTQKGTVISPAPEVRSSGITDAVDDSAADWPQLTLLTRNRVKEQ